MPAYKRQAEPSKGNFLKWEAGESKDLVILSEEGTKSYTHWIDNEATECKGENCALCIAGAGKSIRWTLLVQCEGEEIPWEMSNQVFYGVEDVAEMTEQLQGLRLRVARHGSGLKTRYSVLPITGETPAPEPVRNMAWYANEVKRLCALANMDPGQELKRFRDEVGAPADDPSSLGQMKAFYTYILEETKDFQGPDEPQPEEPADIGGYF